MLLAELQAKFPDIDPKPMMGGGVEQPWLMPIYGMGAEMELIDFLYSFVRLIRPELIVELGCHLGLTSYALGRAAQQNGQGRVVVCDIDPAFVMTTAKRTAGLPVDCRLCPAEELREVEMADLAFIDEVYESRPVSLQRMKPGSVAVMHDTRQHQPLRDAINGMKYPAIHFDTWRGFSIVKIGY